MLRVVESLQRQFREHVRERFPNQKPPCHTCALNPSTNDWKGMENTVLHFANAMQATQPFYCHDGAPFSEEKGWAVDIRTARLCAGFSVLMAADAAHDDPGRCVRQAIAEAIGRPELRDHNAIREMAKSIPIADDAAPGYDIPADGRLEHILNLVLDTRGIDLARRS